MEKCKCGGRFIKFATYILHKFKKICITYQCEKCLRFKEVKKYWRAK